jgi:hypothetical protein
MIIGTGTYNSQQSEKHRPLPIRPDLTAAFSGRRCLTASTKSQRRGDAVDAWSDTPRKS